MKHLMKLLVVVIVFITATESFAQRFGIKAGLNLSNILIKDDEDTYSDDFDIKPGFHVGAVAEFPINDVLSFEPGLLVSTKGTKASSEDVDFITGDVTTTKSTLNLVYIDIPLNAKASFDVGAAKIYGTFGPYVGIGIAGKTKDETTNAAGDKETVKEDVKWGSDDSEDGDDFKRLDLGLSVGAGVEINSFLIGLSYNYGLANISPYTEGGFKINNRVLGVSVGYMFGKK